MNSLPLCAERERAGESHWLRHSPVSFHLNSITKSDPLPFGDLFCDGIVLSDELQEFPKDTCKDTLTFTKGTKDIPRKVQSASFQAIQVLTCTSKTVLEACKCLTGRSTWRQRDPARRGCSAPRAWAEGKKTPATRRLHETPGNHRGRDVWSGSWLPRHGS